MITIFGLKNCDTCKKAVKALQANTVAHEFVDIRTEADLADRVPVWLEAVGSKALINTRSTTWRGLDEAQRGRAETDPAALLVENPTLIKRPVIEAGEAVTVGWSDVIEQGLTSR
ncbi:ArsC/Spx/MgsR family protein [Oceanicaulis alexandrii]|uniref:ArsC/Spx/MgsR family protein n=1 Tax=Oceanicaulis alexandrii TaxID=153233 RepID=UPI00235421A3|nr:ArsC/Spx/MgsR family protein [Oceanicaulis alexandrii]